MPSLSIRQVLPILVITPFLMTAGITAFIHHEGSRRAVNDLAKQLTQRAGDQIDNRIITYLQKAQTINQTLLNSDRSEIASFTDFSRLERFFWQQTQDSKELIYPSYGDEQGNFVGVEMEEQNKTVVHIKDASTGTKRNSYLLDETGKRTQMLKSVDYDPRARPWYQQAAQTEKPTWSPIYLSTSGVMMIAATTPLYTPEMRMQGILVYNLPLVGLSDLLRKTNLSQSGQMFILERNGNLVASSTEVPLGQKDGTAERLSVSQSNSALIRAAAQQVTAKLGDLQTVKTAQFTDFQFNGETQYIGVEPIQDERGLDWLLVMVVPESDFMGGIQANIRSSLWVAFAIAGISIVISIVASRWLMRPLGDLIEAAKDIEEQRFEADHLEAVKNRSDEIGQLARVFEHMADIVYARERQFQNELRDLKDKSKQAPRALPGSTQISREQQLLEQSRAMRGAMQGQSNSSQSYPVNSHQENRVQNLLDQVKAMREDQ